MSAVGHRVTCMACMRRVGIASGFVVRANADMRRNQFTAAVVAAIDDTTADGVQRDLRFVVVHGRAAGHIVHVSVMHAGQRRKLAMDARRAQRGDQLADFDRACFHAGFFEERGAQRAGRFVSIRHDGRKRGVLAA